MRAPSQTAASPQSNQLCRVCPERASCATQGIRLLRTACTPPVRRLQTSRADNMDRNGIALSIGAVFLHKSQRYKGVVSGWDRTCERQEWLVKHAGVNPYQPFYEVLPDEVTCPELTRDGYRRGLCLIKLLLMLFIAGLAAYGHGVQGWFMLVYC